MMKMKHFKEAEFRDWADDMAEELLVVLAKFRFLWDKPVLISPAAGSLGRHLGPDRLSAHNVDKWGKVFAVDLFPTGMHGNVVMGHAAAYARRAGAMGIGLYADTTLGGSMAPMIHIDVRPDRTKLAAWSRVNHRYGGINLLIEDGWQIDPKPEATVKAKPASKRKKKASR